jgi:glucosamine-6-phosphate deaminase
VRTGPAPETVVQQPREVNGNGGDSPTVLSPQPTTSRLLRASSPAREYPLRSHSPDGDLVPDRMASRIPEPELNQRLTPTPEAQNRVGAVGA